MADTIPNYPFDPTGVSPINLIDSETQTLISPSWKDFHFIIPKVAPFFGNSIVITHVDTNRVLLEGVDYLLTHKFLDASRATARTVYGSITFLDNLLTGPVTITYQTVGGDWLISDSKITEILTNIQINPRISTWDSIIDVPYQFPIIDHDWNLSDMVGLSEVIDALGTIQTVIEEKPNVATLLGMHTSDFGNPHKVTKEQIGLGSLEDMPNATTTDAQVGIRDDRVMTPLKVKEAIERFAITSDKEYYSKVEIDHLLNQLRIELS